MSETLYYIAYKGCKGEKKDAPALVVLTHDGQRIEIKQGGVSAQPFSKVLANALIAKQKNWKNGAVLTLEPAKGSTNDAGAAKIQAEHEAEVAELKEKLAAAEAAAKK